MEELSKLPNIGKVLEQQLNEVGIETCAELKAIGSRQAWLRIKSIDDSACLHKLQALEGAIEGVKKTQLSPEVKVGLKEFFNSAKG